MTKGLFIEPPMTEAEAAARVTPGERAAAQEFLRERRRRAGLHLWYDVHFSGAISVAEAMERFGRVDEVECIEPVPRMVPAGATVSQADFSRTSGSDNVAIPGFAGFHPRRVALHVACRAGAF